MVMIELIHNLLQIVSANTGVFINLNFYVYLKDSKHYKLKSQFLFTMF